jgi:N-acetylmuramic acid 6-phosphate etherase
MADQPHPGTDPNGGQWSPTEQRNPRTVDIDQRPALDVLRMLNAENAMVAEAVDDASPDLARVVEWVVEAISSGGCVHYFGAGTSGRLAVLDAAEVGPTFGARHGVFAAHLAGGDAALWAPMEGVEDDETLGGRDAGAVKATDVAIGITASGQARYVAGALRAARTAGARTVLLSSNPAAPLADLADCHVVTDTGPEAIAGSTRLKAGSAHKMVLGNLSTAAMVLLGRTYSNLMVSVDGLNSKLRARQVSILREASGAPLDQCREELLRCGGDLRLALVCLLSGRQPEAARAALRAADGSVRRALAEFTEFSAGN